MVNDELIEIQALEAAFEGMFTLSFLFMFLQYLLMLVLSSTLSFVWNLINSQINFVYLPLMIVNTPGQVSFYLEVLIMVCTFDPLPMDLIYEVAPVWSFDWVNAETNRGSFSRIGLEDRNIINVMGSMVVFIFLFLVT